MRAVVFISILVLVTASLIEARPKSKVNKTEEDHTNLVEEKDAGSKNAKLARPAPEKPVVRKEEKPAGMPSPTFPMVSPDAAPNMPDPRARLAMMMQAAQMQNMMQQQQGQGQMDPRTMMNPGMGVMPRGDNPFASMMPRGQGQDMTPLSPQQQRQMMMMAMLQQQQMMQQQQAMMAAGGFPGRQPTPEQGPMDPREAMVMMQQQQQQIQLDKIKEMQRQQQEQEGMAEDEDITDSMPGPTRQSLKAFRQRLRDMMSQGKGMSPQVPSMDQQRQMMMQNPMMAQGPMMGRPPMMPQNPIMAQGPMMGKPPMMPQNPMMAQGPMMGKPPMMPQNPMMAQGPMMGRPPMMPQTPMMPQKPMMSQNPMENPMTAQGPMLGRPPMMPPQMMGQRPMMAQNPMMPPQMMGRPPMMAQNPMMPPQMMGRPPMMPPQNAMMGPSPMMKQGSMMGQNPMMPPSMMQPGPMMAQNPMMMQGPLMPRNPINPNEIEGLRSVLANGKGPIVVPLHSIQHVMGLESRLTDIRDELIRSFYMDLMQYKAMSQQFRSKMSAKLGMIHQIDAKLGTPIRSALAEMSTKHHLNLPLTSPDSPPSTIIRRLKESVDDSQNKVYTAAE